MVNVSDECLVFYLFWLRTMTKSTWEILKLDWKTLDFVSSKRVGTLNVCIRLFGTAYFHIKTKYTVYSPVPSKNGLSQGQVGKLSELLCAVLCITLVQSDTHMHVSSQHVAVLLTCRPMLAAHITGSVRL